MSFITEQSVQIQCTEKNGTNKEFKNTERQADE